MANAQLSDDIFLHCVPDTVPDLVESFSKLLLNASGDSKTLNKFQEIISTEIEFVRASSSECSSYVDDKESLESLVTHAFSFLSLEEIRNI